MKNIRYSVFAWLLLLTLASTTACKKEVDSVEQQPVQKNRLVSSKLVGYLPASSIRNLATAQGFPQFNDQLKYDIVVFSMVYYTHYQGTEIQASGLMCFPRNSPTPPPVLSAQHGTQFAHADAPSNFPASFNGPELFASVGYATFIPDYIGFGASKQVLQPYYNAEYSAAAVVDMLKAGQEFCRQEDIPISNKLFLAGYSEGGYVTLAAQKEIEKNPIAGLNLTAVAAGAGGYDMAAMLGSIASAPQYSNPAYLALLVQAYNTANGWNRPTADFFSEPYASKIPALLDGSKTGSQINKELVDKPSQLFSPAFFSALGGNGEASFKNALAANSLTNWSPKTPLRLYHGTADEVVPYGNSQSTYDALKSKGASQISLIPIPAGTHGTSFQPMLINVLPWFETMR